MLGAGWLREKAEPCHYNERHYHFILTWNVFCIFIGRYWVIDEKEFGDSLNVKRIYTRRWIRQSSCLNVTLLKKSSQFVWCYTVSPRWPLKKFPLGRFKNERQNDGVISVIISDFTVMHGAMQPITLLHVHIQGRKTEITSCHRSPRSQLIQRMLLRFTPLNPSGTFTAWRH